jgi:serine/threonine-protein kinase
VSTDPAPGGPPSRTDPPPNYGTVGRYTIHDELASGGMATVHLGRLRGAAGFSRIVAIKRLRARLAQDRDFVAMFTDEARVASRIRHPGVVPTLDVVADGRELFLVMEYIHGETLAELLRAARARHQPVPPEILATIVLDALRGLHEAHEARNERGELLDVVHRDISPQNLLVGADGATRILDFGIAKAAGQLHTTASGTLKGKLAYMPPEQLLHEPLDRRADLYALGVVFWEALTGQRLFSSRDLSDRLLPDEIQPPSAVAEDLPPELDRVVLRAIQSDKGRRYSTAAEMARALEAAIVPASPPRVASWVQELARDKLDERAHLVARIETTADDETAAAPVSIAGLRAAPFPSAPPRPLALPATPPRITLPVAGSTEPTKPTLAIPPPAPLPPSVNDSANLSVAEVPPEPTRPRRVPAWALLVIPSVLLGAGIVWRASLPPAPPVAAASAALPAASAIPSAQEFSAPAASLPVPSAVPAPPVSGAAPAESSPPRPAGPPAARPSGPPPPRPAGDNCSPPYTIKDGIKHYKRNCFR